MDVSDGQMVVDVRSLRARKIDIETVEENVMAVIASFNTKVAVPNDAGRGLQ